MQSSWYLPGFVQTWFKCSCPFITPSLCPLQATSTINTKTRCGTTRGIYPRCVQPVALHLWRPSNEHKKSGGWIWFFSQLLIYFRLCFDFVFIITTSQHSPSLNGWHRTYLQHVHVWWSFMHCLRSRLHRGTTLWCAAPHRVKFGSAILLSSFLLLSEGVGCVIVLLHLPGVELRFAVFLC